MIEKIIQDKAKGILAVPGWQYRHWYAALTRITKASYLIALRALKMRNHPAVPMRRWHFLHLACVVDGSLIPSVDLVGHSTEPALASAGTLPLSHLINSTRAAGCLIMTGSALRPYLLPLQRTPPLKILIRGCMIDAASGTHTGVCSSLST